MGNARIMVVEDEGTIALNIKHRLEKLGYSVPNIVSSGEEAIEKVDQMVPDLILMDVMLKGKMDGVDTANALHDNFDIPIIYLSAYSDANLLNRAKMTEPYGYIVKPFKENDLRTNIKMALYRHEMDKKKRV